MVGHSSGSGEKSSFGREHDCNLEQIAFGKRSEAMAGDA